MKFHHVSLLFCVLMLGWIATRSSAYQDQDNQPIPHFFDQLKQGQAVTFEPAGDSGVAIKWNRDNLNEGQFKVLKITSEFVDLEEPRSGDQFRLSKYFVATIRTTGTVKPVE